MDSCEWNALHYKLNMDNEVSTFHQKAGYFFLMQRIIFLLFTFVLFLILDCWDFLFVDWTTLISEVEAAGVVEDRFWVDTIGFELDGLLTDYWLA